MGTGVNLLLTLSLWTRVSPYSSQVQQPVRATAILGGHQHTRWAALFDREQGRAGSLHPEGYELTTVNRVLTVSRR